MNPFSNSPHILLTVDVEDWFQVENLRERLSLSSWSSCELRVENNVHQILDLLDMMGGEGYGAANGGSAPAPFHRTGAARPNHNHVRAGSPLRATFFVLGWIAERMPQLVKEIAARGHEIACHGYYHQLCHLESKDHLKRDLLDSKKLLEDITGCRVHGYRAPSFSVTHDVLKLIEDCGFSYDSSFNSFTGNKRYGRIILSDRPRNGIAFKISETFHELPISNLKVGKYVLPWGGGGYFRAMWIPLFKMGVQSILKKEKAYLFYIHPWEIDPDQPRVKEIPALFKFRHYINLNKTLSKLTLFLRAFGNYPFITCNKYLELLSAVGDHPKGGRWMEMDRSAFPTLDNHGTTSRSPSAPMPHSTSRRRPLEG